MSLGQPVSLCIRLTAAVTPPISRAFLKRSSKSSGPGESSGDGVLPTAQFASHAAHLCSYYPGTKFRMEPEYLIDGFALCFSCRSAPGACKKQLFPVLLSKTPAWPTLEVTVIRQRLQPIQQYFGVESLAKASGTLSITARFAGVPPRIPPINAKSNSCLQNAAVVQIILSSKGLARNRLRMASVLSFGCRFLICSTARS